MTPPSESVASPRQGGGCQLLLRDLTKSFGGLPAVDGVSLDVPAGAFVSLLGPSGSGKTTTLNLVAGFLAADSGDILFDDRSVADVPPHKRNIGMVFQSYALFPHMTVADNVGFPLRMRTSLSREAGRGRIAEVLALMQLSPLAQRYPRQLSGGQQQRVAMARALVSNPRLLLMDEPLGALDKKLREQLQVEIQRVHRAVGATILYVTHDQSEALTMSDIVVVMNRGRIAQLGTPRALYEAPANAFVADFLGDANLLPGIVAGAEGEQAMLRLADGQILRAARGATSPAIGERAALLIRPEDIAIDLRADAASGENTLPAIVSTAFYHGDVYKLDVRAGASLLKIKVPRAHGADLAPGRQISLSWKAASARLLPIEAGDAEIFDRDRPS